MKLETFALLLLVLISRTEAQWEFEQISPRIVTPSDECAGNKTWSCESLSCPRTCAFRRTKVCDQCAFQVTPCPNSCDVQRCTCAEGLWENEQGRCVSEIECFVPPPPEFPMVQTTGDTSHYNRQYFGGYPLMQGRKYRRDVSFDPSWGRIVTPPDSPGKVCGPNEKYNRCHIPGCPRTCAYRKQLSCGYCDGLLGGCLAACVPLDCDCVDGFYRNEEGICVPEDACFGRPDPRYGELHSRPLMAAKTYP